MYSIQSFRDIWHKYYLAQINAAYAHPQGIELRVGGRPSGVRGDWRAADWGAWIKKQSSVFTKDYVDQFPDEEKEECYYITALEDFDPRRYTQAQKEQALAQAQREFTQDVAGTGAAFREHDSPACQEYANTFLQKEMALPQVPVLQQLGASEAGDGRGCLPGVPPPPPPPPMEAPGQA